MRVLIYIITLLFSSVAWAEEARPEKDPFFPPERALLAPAVPSAEDGWGRDPFSSPLTEKTPGRTGEGQGDGKKPITGIIYSKKSRVAMIGGEMVQEGSMVGDRRLVEIRRRSVIFQTASGGYEEVYVDDFSIGK
jgi:hypothetical protein